MKQAPTWSWRVSEDRKINNGIWKVCGPRDSDLQDPQGGDQSRSNIRKTFCSRSGVQSGLWRSVGYLSSCQSHAGCVTHTAWRWFLMLKFPNAPPTLLLKEPFLKSTTLSKLKRRQLWLVKLLGWIALWMLNSKDSQGVQVWKSSLEEEASSVVLVPGEPLLLLFYYVLWASESPAPPILWNSEEEDHVLQTATQNRKDKSFIWWPLGEFWFWSHQLFTSVEDHWRQNCDFVLLIQNTLGFVSYIYPPPMMFAEDGELVRTMHMWLEVPAWVLGYPRLSHLTIPDAGLFWGEYHSEVVLFSGTFSNRRVSCVGAHNLQSSFLLTLSRQCVVHFCL